MEWGEWVDLGEDDTLYTIFVFIGMIRNSDIGMAKEGYFVDIRRKDTFSGVFHEILKNIINE